MFCSKCGKEIFDEAVICVHCGNEIKPVQVQTVSDEPSIGLNILSFFIPLLGLILYLVWMSTTPKRAKSVGKSALIGFIISIVASIIWVTSVKSCAYCGKFGIGFEEENGLYYCDEHYIDALQNSIYEIQQEIDVLEGY